MTKQTDGIMPEVYKDRGQSYVKHVFLEAYIEKVAFKLLYKSPDFVYVDGFSGPWKSEGEDYSDTSFALVINKLRFVKNTYKKKNKPRSVRCLFIEKNAKAFKRLQNATLDVPDIQTETLNGSFEDNIDKVTSFIGKSFSFSFIDPKGWKGYSLTKITPLLQKRGEVMINFMFDHINRFIADSRPEITGSFDSAFGDDQWFNDFSTLVNHGVEREDAILRVYLDRLKKVGSFKHVTSTRIKHPKEERTYFHLVYGTNHHMGIVEFRKAEKKAAHVQEQIRVSIKIDKKTHETGVSDLFGTTKLDAKTLEFERARTKNTCEGKQRLINILNSKTTHKFEEIQGEVLETPLVWPEDLTHWLMSLKKSELILIPAMASRERSPKQGYLIKVQKEILSTHLPS